MNFPDNNLRQFVIVDDCEDDAFLLRYRLRLGGIANPVTTIDSALEGHSYLTSLYAASSVPAVVFLDIKMPGGFDLIAALRDDVRFDDTRIIVTTYSNDPNDLSRALLLRADGYILKFPDPDILAEFIHHGPWFDVARPTAPNDADHQHHVLCA